MRIDLGRAAMGRPTGMTDTGLPGQGLLVQPLFQVEGRPWVAQRV
jgi:hypothetical protein